jgi:hypothetical protein
MLLRYKKKSSLTMNPFLHPSTQKSHTAPNHPKISKLPTSKMSSTTTQTTTQVITLSSPAPSPDFVTKAQNDVIRDNLEASIGSDPDNQPDPWQIQPVDLHALEAGILRNRPVYTRTRLQRYAAVRDRILTDKSFKYYCEKDVYGTERCLWQRSSAEDDFVDMAYLTYVELHSDLHVPGKRSPTVGYLHDLNLTEDGSKDDELILCPVVIQSLRRAEGTRWLRMGYEDHFNTALMAEYHAKIADVRKMWESSVSFRRLENGFKNTALHVTQIKKIVCFGLGRLQWKTDGATDCQEVLQHLTAIGIARMLNAIYQAQDPTTEPIKIFLQDPLYTPKDDILLQEVYPDGALSLVANPDGFLEVDNNTLVMAPYVNIDCPVMQICADLCRPAGFLCDSVVVDVEQSFYTWRNRASPRVANMFKGYWRTHFDGMPVEKRMFDDVCGGRRFWLWDMNLWLKPKGVEKKG